MLIILDRDGVINYDSPAYIKSPQEWIPLPGSLQAIAALKHAGFRVVIASNQSGLARGLFDEHMLTSIHQKMSANLAAMDTNLDAIYYCPHHPDDNCQCRKPKPGMLLQIAADFHIDLHKDAILIGDSWRDLQAAASVHCQAILTKTGNGEKTLREHNVDAQVIVCDDLAAAARWVIALTPALSQRERE